MTSSPRVRLPLAYRLCVVIAKAAAVPLMRRDWRGAEHLDRPGGIIVCPNHISHVDFIATAHFLYDNGRPPFYLAKSTLFEIPVVGRLLKAARQIPVHRNTGRAADAYREAVSRVQQGATVPLYPEGTITRDPGVWPMTAKTGAARIALETRCPVIPLAQWGAQEIMPPYAGRLRLFPIKTMHLLAGPPVDLDDLSDRPVTAEVLREATDRIMAAIIVQLEELRGEKAPVERYDLRQHQGDQSGKPGQHRTVRPDHRGEDGR